MNTKNLRKFALALTALWIAIVFTGTPTLAQQTPVATQDASISALKTYLINHCTALNQASDALQKDSQTFYDEAQAAKFDYAGMWQNNQTDVMKVIQAAQIDWVTLNPQYEGMEGIVAGVPLLTQYDPILDSGVPGQVNLDVPLPDGKVLSKPGNLMALTQETLWGTDKTLIIDMVVDFNGNGTQDFGEVMPNAVLLKGFADSLADYTDQLLKAASAWTPTTSDVFTALVINVPTMTDFFNAWKESRFVLGDKATRGDFAVTSRLADIHSNVSSWKAMWADLSPTVSAIDPARAMQIATELNDIDTFITGLYQEEQNGKRFTPTEADLYSSEAQDQATIIVGQITQVAAELNIPLPQGQ